MKNMCRCGLGATMTLALLANVSRAWALEHTMKADDPFNTSSFNTGQSWDDDAAPVVGDTYVANKTLRTPISGSPTFTGDVLTVTGQVLWKGTDNSSITVSNLVLRGSINNGVGNTTGNIYGNITLPDGATGTFGTGSESDKRILHFYAPLSGSGSLNLFIPRPSSDMKEIWLYAANTNFTGPIKLIGGGKLTLFDETNLGGNPATWNPLQVTMNGSVLRFANSMALDDPNRGIWLSNMTVSASSVYPGGRFEVATGATVTLGCVVGGEGPFAKTDAGTLILAVTNTYTGATTVSQGTLLVNSETNATASLSVAAGAALGGTGTVHCAVSLGAGCSLDLAGNGYGTLTLADAGGITMDGASLSYDLREAGDGASDRIALGGPLTLSGAGTVAINLPESGLSAGTYTLISYPSRSGDGTLTLVPAFANAELVIGDTAVTLEVSGSGASQRMVWQGNAADNTWDFSAGNWFPTDAAFVDGVDVLFDDLGVASVPVLLGADASPRNVVVASTNNAYIFDASGHVLTALEVSKYGTGSLSLVGDTHLNTLTVGFDDAGTFVGGGAVTVDGALAVNSLITVHPTAGTFTESATSVISGDGDVVLGCNAALYGTNTFSGKTTIGYVNNTKSITLYSDLALGTTAGGTVLRGGTAGGYNKLIVGNGVTVTDEPLTITGGGGYRAGLWSVSGGASAWDGDIVIASDGQLQLGSGSGNTFTIGSVGRTVITNQGSVTLSFRDWGTTVLNSKLAMPWADLNRDDGGWLMVNSQSNVIKNLYFLQGNIRLNTNETFVSSPTLAIGKGSDSNNGNKCKLDLNGFTLMLGRVLDYHGDAFNGTADEGYQRILCTVPSTLIVSGSSASSYVRVGSVMSGPLTFIKEGSGSFLIGQTNAMSGAVVVSNGVLAVNASGGFGTDATNVVVAGGTLSLSNNLAVCEAASVVFPENATGLIDLPAGVNVSVSTLWYGEKQKYGGTYGASGSGATFIDDARFTGMGVLTVLHGSGGTLMTIQ